ncbi:hypothetical protein TP70_02355 [Staphylococcus microti]|uniref:Phage protein n=1 Tax=Staphylococcus microti TaxID=569857 RepID=A0A0D6XSA3_9STAP|nr:hypothetical protein [Staphylococcus microti]KIX91472.1 hypothetical protein TP70_02355 [Staphylococcus microti]PNZ82459.1 hypothetical protein CD132_03965 [Staphylococcus microti]PNZ83644.1 hypothetical protein CD132_01835 [Staphylococcus microti]SUM57055.1 phage protein [Staphylococcus microti]
MQPRYVSAEQALFRAVMNQLYSSPLFKQIKERVYDHMPIDINHDGRGNLVPNMTYVVVGETNTLSFYQSAGHDEEIAITFHLYHRNTDSPLASTDEARGLLSMLRYVVEQLPVMAHYTTDKVRVETQQVITDVDGQTRHGILRVKYYVKHNVKFKNKE